MKIEVLLSTMHQKDFSIIEKMNLRTDAVIINQCDRFGYSEYIDDEKRVKMYSFNERGVGRSRNNALLRASGDICLLADDDLVYADNYEEIVRSAFVKNPKADMIMFNVPSNNPARDDIKVLKTKRVRFYNCLKYGAFNIAFRREKIIKANIFFSLLFGGGAKYSCGEDSLFIWENLKKGTKIYTCPEAIAVVHHEESTWFKGYNKKYFYDRGVYFKSLSKLMAPLLILQYALRKVSLYKNETTMLKAIQYMFEGCSEYKI